MAQVGSLISNEIGDVYDSGRIPNVPKNEWARMGMRNIERFFTQVNAKRGKDATVGSTIKFAWPAS